MEKKKTGWAGIEGRKTRNAPPPKEQHKAAAKAAKKAGKAPARKPKEVKPPYGVLIGRRTVDGEYLLDRQSYDSPEELLKFVSGVLKNETHEQGLREVMIHLRPVAAKEA